MQPFPHRYTVRAVTPQTGDVALRSDGLHDLPTDTPEAFNGPGNRWSPETLLVGAIVDCFALTFRAVAQASRLTWTSLDCEASGTLDRVSGVTRFTDVDLRVKLDVPHAADLERARKVVEKSERNCLVANSLTAAMHFENEIAAEPETVDAAAA
jgi:organic hydroperoxide reductase OsmC/OhrA